MGITCSGLCPDPNKSPIVQPIEWIEEDYDSSASSSGGESTDACYTKNRPGTTSSGPSSEIIPRSSYRSLSENSQTPRNTAEDSVDETRDNDNSDRNGAISWAKRLSSISDEDSKTRLSFEEMMPKQHNSDLKDFAKDAVTDTGKSKTKIVEGARGHTNQVIFKENDLSLDTVTQSTTAETNASDVVILNENLFIALLVILIVQYNTFSSAMWLYLAKILGQGPTKNVTEANDPRRNKEALDSQSCHDREGCKTITMREQSDVPEPSFWPHRPVLLCVNTPVSSDQIVPQHGNGPCSLGVPFQFNSELFEGTCLVRLRDVPSNDCDADSSYFKGRKRLFQAIVQGRFKEELLVSDVLTGHEFVRPLKHLPPPWLMRTCIAFIRRLSPGVEIVLNSTQPHALAILAATSQVVNAEKPGKQPSITDNNIKEKMTSFGGRFNKDGVLITRLGRKRYLSNPKNAAKFRFKTDTVYTFDFYQNILNARTYSLDLGFVKIDLASHLNGQPIQILSKTVDGRYLWSFQLWHEKLIS